MLRERWRPDVSTTDPTEEEGAAADRRERAATARPCARGTGVCMYRHVPHPACTREHVMPQAFGTFENSFVLHDFVCADCNRILGHDVEDRAALATLEGVHRFLTRVKGPSGLARLTFDRVSYTLTDPGWEVVVAYFAPSLAGSEPVVMFRPQVLLTSKTSGRTESFSTERLRLHRPEVADVGRIALYCLTEQEEDDLLVALRDVGLNFKREGTAPPPSVVGGKIEVKVTATIDVLAQRLAAKIAFSYLACRTDAAFVLRPEFDAVAAFIRHGTPDSIPLVVVDSEPILAGEGDWQITDSHLVVVEEGERGDIFAQVTLFNLLRYRVLLARRYPGLYRPDIPQGHQFSWRTRAISSLAADSKMNLVRLR